MSTVRERRNYLLSLFALLGLILFFGILIHFVFFEKFNIFIIAFIIFIIIAVLYLFLMSLINEVEINDNGLGFRVIFFRKMRPAIFKVWTKWEDVNEVTTSPFGAAVWIRSRRYESNYPFKGYIMAATEYTLLNRRAVLRALAERIDFDRLDSLDPEAEKLLRKAQQPSLWERLAARMKR